MNYTDYENYPPQNYKTSKDYELLFELVHKERWYVMYLTKVAQK